MVISYVIKGFLVHNVLVDTGSVTNIIFAKAFRQMQEPDDKIHDATHPLCGFGGRQIVALGKITMSVTFSYVHNIRTKQVVFNIVDMEYPYNAIIGRGTLNAFEAILHPTYLCYLRMPEGLKNARGSFSRMTAKVLHSQIGSNVLTYVDDIIVKTTKQENHIADLQETFANFRQAGLKLNPEKCVFGVKKGKFLGCLVSTKGIEANLNKIEAILRMEPPNTKKGAQRLGGRLASLNRFISRSTERNLPFFEILKSAEVFQWGPTQQRDFEELKQYLIDLTTLTPPLPGAPLLLYVAASHSAVSVALVQEKQDGQVKKQALVYFISEVLSLSKKNYIELEKVLYVVLMASM
jgi:hypothetical protein